MPLVGMYILLSLVGPKLEAGAKLSVIQSLGHWGQIVQEEFGFLDWFLEIGIGFLHVWVINSSLAPGMTAADCGSEFSFCILSGHYLCVFSLSLYFTRNRTWILYQQACKPVKEDNLVLDIESLKTMHTF